MSSENAPVGIAQNGERDTSKKYQMGLRRVCATRYGLEWEELMTMPWPDFQAAIANCQPHMELYWGGAALVSRRYIPVPRLVTTPALAPPVQLGPSTPAAAGKLPRPVLDGGEGKIKFINTNLQPQNSLREPVLDVHHTSNSGTAVGKSTATGLVTLPNPTKHL